MTSRTQKYSLFLDVKVDGMDTLCDPIATVALREEHGVLEEFALRYSSAYLDSSWRFPLDPLTLPLTPKDTFLHCRSGGLPGLLDDYLPDDWGRRVLAQLAFYQTGKRISPKSPIDQLSALGYNRIGALKWTTYGERPQWVEGVPIERLCDAETAAQNIESNQAPTSIDEHSLIYLANCGTGVGGARPKALIHDQGKKYLAKFNSFTRDDYNNARVELACLLMAKDAGINVHAGKVVEGINRREVLLLERFDIDGDHNKHLITVNSLLKLQENQCDRGGAFQYDDIANLIKKYSLDPQHDLEQLLRQMLFNAAINNIDDHERNFSFISCESGYVLSPAYDMVPSLAQGQYHVAGYQYSPTPPRPSEINKSGRVFGLPKATVKIIADEVINAISNYEKYAEKSSLSAQDYDLTSKVIKK